MDFYSDIWTADFYLADFLHALDRQRISALGEYSQRHHKDRRRQEANRATCFLHRVPRYHVMRLQQSHCLDRAAWVPEVGPVQRVTFSVRRSRQVIPAHSVQ